ncbi:MAG: Ni/Fe-hydrogenase cytochrome b subunit [Chloroflexi bacterium]|nr:Ni/Fe-hydrogenase cytochrome b subunit [Chloroflexota bacterium]
MMQQKRPFPYGTLILSIVALVSVPVMIIRYLYGLGAMSNLSDGRAWGLWISFDLYCGVALAAGGFTLAALVHIFNAEKYHPVVRPAILTAFLGYIIVILALLVDLGQPWYIWHIMINWNIHSPLFEVGWCVMLYTGVLALEMSPALFERLHWRIPLRFIGMIQIPLIIAGIVISTGHQNSLGSMLLLLPYTLDPLWYTPILPALFFVSAVAVGPAMVILESTLSGMAFGHAVKLDVLSGLGRIIPFFLGIYLIMKLADLAAAGQLDMIVNSYPQNVYWLAEVIVGVVLPMVLFSIPKIRNNRAGLFGTALLVIGGLIFNRFNVSLLWQEIRPGYTYFPHWMEFAVSAGVIAWAIIVFMLAIRLLPISEHRGEAEAPAGRVPEAAAS